MPIGSPELERSRSMKLGIKLSSLAVILFFLCGSAFAQDLRDYRVLATNKTSTMEKELNEAASSGFHFEGTMGGESSFGGKEVVVIMSRPKGGPLTSKYSYKLLATNRTGTMQKELQAAGDDGYEYNAQTVFQTAFGGQEVVVILERDREKPLRRVEYKLLATQRTSTMEKELQQAGETGFVFVGITVAETALGGKEVVSILRRQRAD
jgi:hypothetical protein